jgi:hypothetical protein
MTDYGEPWVIIKNESISPAFRTLKDRNGACPKDAMERSVDCVNALQGIPTESLGEVKKAWLFYKMQTHQFNTGKIEVSPDESVEAGIRLHERNREYFPPELTALLDSVKEGM